jgi:hypothetical protein
LNFIIPFSLGGDDWLKVVPILSAFYKENKAGFTLRQQIGNEGWGGYWMENVT